MKENIEMNAMKTSVNRLVRLSFARAIGPLANIADIKEVKHLLMTSTNNNTIIINNTNTNKV